MGIYKFIDLMPVLQVHNYDGVDQSRHEQQWLQSVLWLDTPYAWQNQIMDIVDLILPFDDHA